VPYPKRKLKYLALAFPALLLFSQALYYLWVFENSHRPPADSCDVVLAYGGEAWRFPAAFQRALSLHRPLYLSGAPSEIQAAGIQAASIPIEVDLDSRAFTTDQNARHAAAYIRSKGFHHVELVTSWFHFPRALFLTRLYLAGTGVDIEPYWAQPIPDDWWKIHFFWIEWIKFWGSLARVLLAGFGGGPPKNLKTSLVSCAGFNPAI
jgi:uncharacterized SAM-binding protein YcdF (DUF218 family)